ncbi:Calcium-dependent lipid-binding (CaLB domain) family protein [Rhynchospora pubera]|uniref:Calcium-dependent lipid-binding (CaLB domain) family protein n=1 Tax=Rhynchospora pubera TaxID=906938 RepID=A0AAV8CQD5_9POAL|nr:Calcium-dependent lipid-binding (CaLB domain) family protein [Rhynchospora pubera]
MSMISGIQGQLLDVTVVACNKLRNTELFSRQDPYVCIEYAHSKFRTRTCTDGGRNPTFQEKFQIPLIEGLRELNVSVGNSNTFRSDDFIGSGRIQLQRVLSQGYDDSSWPIQTENLKAAGEVKLIMHFSGTSQKHNTSTSTPYGPPSAWPYGQRPYGQSPPLSAYPPAGGYPYPAPPSCPPLYPGGGYPPPPMINLYPPTAYPPSPYPLPYGRQPYQTPPAQTYPPPPTGLPPYYQPAGPYPGTYPQLYKP